MTTLDDLDLFTPTPATPTGARRRPHRHSWRLTETMPDDSRVLEWSEVCRMCKAVRDEAITRRNRRNKANGRGTSRDLAAYLGGRNVELLGLAWDVEAGGCCIQSKRDAQPCGPVRALGLVDYVASRCGMSVPVLFHVAPRARLTSGRVWMRLEQWVREHGWQLPPDARLHTPGPLMEVPLSTFRDWHIGSEK